MSDYTQESSSFRDPDGFLFYYKDSLYRQINSSFRQNYEHLVESGLYEKLVNEGLLIPHSDSDVPPPDAEKCYKVIRPEPVPFVSYPYEWSFTQLKSAALCTLDIQKRALQSGMILRDATAYNIQFVDGRPVLIDTLSFERYEEGRPWNAYRQFCQHFLAPLALMSHKDVRFGQLSRIYVDGVPLDLAKKLLPFKTNFMFSLLTNIHAHAKSQKHYEDKKADAKKIRLSKRSLDGIISNLASGISKLKPPSEGTEWGNYYSDTNYSDPAFEHKMRLVRGHITKIGPKSVWDLGANTGVFSRISSGLGIPTVSFDIDPVAVEKNYQECVRAGEKNLLPLILDLTNPSPNVGWANSERRSFMERGPADMVLALALIHHLAISNNMPLEMVSRFFGDICSHLVIEFVPKSDSQVQRLLSTREDIFSQYDEESFESAFSRDFETLEKTDVQDSQRVVYLMRRLDS